MTTNEQITAADDERYRALMEKDADSLAKVLHEDFKHIHGSGRIDTRSSLIESVASGRVRYKKADRHEVEILHYPDFSVMRGTATVSVEVSGELRINSVAFSTIWLTKPAGPRLLNWQATLLPR